VLRYLVYMGISKNAEPFCKKLKPVYMNTLIIVFLEDITHLFYLFFAIKNVKFQMPNFAEILNKFGFRVEN